MNQKEFDYLVADLAKRFPQAARQIELKSSLRRNSGRKSGEPLPKIRINNKDNKGKVSDAEANLDEIVVKDIALLPLKIEECTHCGSPIKAFVVFTQRR